MNYKLNLAIVLIFLILIFSCKSQKIITENNQQEKPAEKTVNFICVVEEKNNISLTLELLDSRVKTIISYYVSGLIFDISKNDVIQPGDLTPEVRQHNPIPQNISHHKSFS